MEHPTTPHKNYCKKCPSHWYPDDPESTDIKTWPEKERVIQVFVCAWRTSKLCKGVCESVGYVESKHKQLLLDSRKDYQKTFIISPLTPKNP